MGRQQNKAELIKFLRCILWRDFPIEEIDDNQSLVESGLVDSLEARQIVVYLEQSCTSDLRDHAIDPRDLRSMATILDITERSTAS
jgi:acyl carrier protein